MLALGKEMGCSRALKNWEIFHTYWPQIQLTFPGDLTEGSKFLPQLPLLVAAKLREAHMMLLLAQADSSNNHEAATDILASIERALELARYCSYKGSGMVPELLVQRAHAQPDNASCLLSAICAISHQQLNHRQAYLLYCRLAELLAYLSKGENVLAPQSTTPEISPVLVCKDPQPSTQSSPHGAGKTKQERERRKSRNLLAYQSWCALKMAISCLNALDNLKRLTSEQHNTDISRELSSRLLTKMPDHLLMGLAGRTESVASLLRKRDPPELVDLTSARQSSVPQGLSWFSVLHHFMVLLQRSLLLTANVHWGLHTTLLTPFFIQEAKSILALISPNNHDFPSKSFLIPKVPTILLQLADSADDSSATHPPSSDTCELVDPQLAAAEGEAAVVWFTPDPVCAPRGTIRGLFGLSAKSFKTHSNLPLTVIAGIKVHVVTTDLGSLSKLHDCWSELDSICATYLSQQATRPLSRSPSRMRHKSLEQARRATPAELKVSHTTGIEECTILNDCAAMGSLHSFSNVFFYAVCVCVHAKSVYICQYFLDAFHDPQTQLQEAVTQLLLTFGYNTEVSHSKLTATCLDCCILVNTCAYPQANRPHVEPHMVSSITRLLRPLSFSIEQGDAFYFFKSLFSPK